MDKVMDRQMKVGKKAGGKVMKMRGGGMARNQVQHKVNYHVRKNKKQDPSKIYFGYGNKGPFTED